jgi:MerR HTH family regulatory protein
VTSRFARTLPFSCHRNSLSSLRNMSFSTAQAAAQIGRTPRTLRKWEQVGLIPPVAQVNGQRTYSEDDVERLREVAKLNTERRRHHQARFVPLDTRERPLPPGLARHREAQSQRPTQTGPLISPPTWASLAQAEVGPTPWAQMTGETETKKLGELPVTCATCWRSLVRHGVTDAQGRRWLSASCETHGVQGRQLWT